MKLTPTWMIVLDLVAVAAAFFLSFAVRIPLRYLSRDMADYMNLLFPLLALRLGLFGLFGLYSYRWFNSALKESVAVAMAVTLGSVFATLALVITTLNSPIQQFPRLVIAYEWALTLVLVGGLRYSLRVLDLRHLESAPAHADEAHHHLVLRQKLDEWMFDAPPDVWMLWYHSEEWSLKRAAKRLFDIMVSLVVLIVVAPVLLIIAVLIKLESPGPIFADTPQRTGKGGTEFRMYKFRGMVQNAHLLLVNNPALWEKYKRNNFKLMEDDPRLTRVGRFIRRTSLDELPNFINVLHGEMSIVGPRARYPFEIVAQAERYPHTKPDILRVMTVKPGVTGPWQVSGRSRLGHEERTHLEARYAEEHTLWGDIRLCLRTIPVVLRKEGAH